MAFGQELKDFVGAARATYDMASDRRKSRNEERRQALMDPIDIEAKQAATDYAKKRVQWFDAITQSDLESQASQRAAQASLMATQAMERDWYPRNQQSVIDARSDATRLAQDRILMDTLFGGGRGGSRTTPPETVEGNVYTGIPEGYDGYAMPEDEDLVPGYADGGLVEEEEEKPQSALPLEGPIPEQRPVTPESNQPAGGESNNRGAGFNMAYEAVREGALWQLAQMGLADEAAVQNPERAQAMAEFLRGRGAAPKSVIDQAYDIVDPDKELPEGERTMAALATVYNHYIKRGEPEKAKAAAASIVQHQRNMFQTYASIAKAAAEGGNMDGALEAAVRAYASVPDGNDLKAVKVGNDKYAIEVIDEATGKTTSKQVYSPQEIGGFIMNVSPASFDEFIMDAAGARNKGGTDSDGGVKMATFDQVNEARENMAGVWEQMASEPLPDSDELRYKGMDEFAPADITAMQEAATDIMANPRNRGDTNVSPRGALEAAMMVANRRPDIDAVAKDGGIQVTYGDTTVWMPRPAFTKLNNVYKRNKKTLDDRAREDTARQRVEAAEARKEQERRMAVRDSRAQQTSDPVMGISVPRSTPAQGGATSTMGIPVGVDNPTQRSIDWLDQLMGQ